MENDRHHLMDPFRHNFSTVASANHFPFHQNRLPIPDHIHYAKHSASAASCYFPMRLWYHSGWAATWFSHDQLSVQCKAVLPLCLPSQNTDISKVISKIKRPRYIRQSLATRHIWSVVKQTTNLRLASQDQLTDSTLMEKHITLITGSFRTGLNVYVEHRRKLKQKNIDNVWDM